MRLSRQVAALPATVPFVAPEALERQRGNPFRLRLGANESPFGVAPGAAEAMEVAGRAPCWYGDPDSWDLRNALGALHSRPINEIAVGCGIDGLLGLLVRALLDPGDVAVASAGSYPTFAYHVSGYGGRLETVPYFGFRNDLDALLDAARFHGARLLYLANPDNPTGSWLDAEDVERFARRLPGDCALILDEAYAECCPALLPDPNRDRTLRLRTFSKAYGMAGARIGYALGPNDGIQALDRIRNHFEVNRLAQAGALASLADRAFLARTVSAIADGRSRLAARAESLGVRALPSGTNFVAFDTGTPERSIAWVEALAARGVFVRRPATPPLDTLVRVTVCHPDDEQELFDALSATLSPA